MVIAWFALFAAAAAVVSRAPRFAAAAVAAALPAYLLRTSLFGLPTTLLEAVILGSLAGFAASRHRNAGLAAFRSSPFFLPSLALLAASVVAVFVAPDLRAAAGVWRAYFLEPLLLLPILAASLGDARGRAALFRILALEAILISALAIAQALGLAPITAPWAAERRATGIYPFPNAVGLFLGPLIPLFAALAAWRGEARRVRILFLAAGVLSFGGILASQTEAAVAAAALALLVLGAASGGLGKTLAVSAALLAALALALLPGARATFLEKATLQDWSGVVRREMWRETVTMLRTRPFTGAGLSGYPTAVAPFHPDPKVEIFQYPHDVVLTVWSELGVLGLLAWGWILAVFLRTLRLGERDAGRPWRLAAGLALFAMLVHGLVDVPYFKNDLAVLTWILLLLPWASSHSGKNETRPVEAAR